MRRLILALWIVLTITLFPALLAMEARHLVGLALIAAFVGGMSWLEREAS